MSETISSKFFEVAITRTKQGELAWSKISARESMRFSDCDTDRSYSAKFGDGKIYLIRKIGEVFINCWVNPDPTLGYYSVGESDDPNLLRLYNIVYNQFPSIDKFLNSFISGY